ncbi:hypothetical protein ACLOJK_029981 [Asimina triloba]
MDKETPLQERLNRLTFYIGKIGTRVAVMGLCCYVGEITKHITDENGNWEFTLRRRTWICGDSRGPAAGRHASLLHEEDGGSSHGLRAL